MLGEAYNDVLVEKKRAEKSWASLQFVTMFLLEVGEELFLLEGYIEGEYVKYSNNLNYLVDQKEIRHFTSFAHFSYEKSRHKYLVADFQGVGLLLTDPAVHSKYGEFSESGDLLHEGIVQFFSHHQCNDLCKALGLKFPRELPRLESVVKWIENSYSHLKDTIQFKCQNVFCNTMYTEDRSILCTQCASNPALDVCNCERCHHEFDYSPFVHFMHASGRPRKCPDCMNSKGDYGF